MPVATWHGWLTGWPRFSRTFRRTTAPTRSRSSFLCEYHLDFRGVGDRAQVIELPDIERSGLPQSYDVAVNIHSFSACSRSAVRWWVEKVAERDVRWLLIVPNTPGQLISTESDVSRED